jgi:hypothetical protein
MAIDNNRTGSRRRLPAVAGALVVMAVVSTWVASGRPWAGSAHHGGLAQVRAVASRPVTAAATDPQPATSDLASSATPPWEAALTGTLRQRAPDPSGVVTITVAGRLSGSRQGSLTILLLGLAAGGGVALQHSVVDLDLRGGGHLGGDVVALDGDTMVAVVGAGGAHLELGIFLQVDPSARTVTGAVTARPTLAGYGS